MKCLIQCCKMRWNSVFVILNRIYKNRGLVSNIFADYNYYSGSSTTIRNNDEPVDRYRYYNIKYN